MQTYDLSLRCFKNLSFASLLGLSLFGKAQAFPSGGTNNASYRPHMQSIYQSITKLMPFVVADGESLKKKEVGEAELQFKNLAEQSKAIHDLALKSDKGQEFLARQLESNTSSAYLRFKEGHHDQSKYFLSEVVSNCFSCHTSRSSSQDSAFTFNLSKDVKLDDFDPLAKARFLSLSRQFEAAESEYEKILLGNKQNLDEFINLDPMVEYLILTIRVKDDSERALKTFTSMSTRNYPQVVKQDLLSWTEALVNIRKVKSAESALDKAKKLINDAKMVMEYPRDRSGLVHFILASKYLEEYLKQENLDSATKASVYYELGRSEMMLNTSLSDGSASAYFEESVRLAPKSALAKKAYARYEENLLAGYSGSSGVNIPQDEKKTLNELKKLAFEGDK